MKNWQNTLLNPENSIQRAIEVLDSESLGIVLVVDDKRKLIGTVTDGDIRRALLRGHKLVDSLKDVMVVTPTIAYPSSSREEILLSMKKGGVMHIPIVDEYKRVVGLETLKQVLSFERLDNPVLLMAGGRGSRLQPLTAQTPKPLLKVGKKPILEIILDQFVAAGFHNFYVSTHYKADLIRDYFGDGSTRGIQIAYLHEDEPLGTAGALGLLPADMPDLPLILMNGDVLTKADFRQLLRFHSTQGGEATLCVREERVQVSYGVVEAKDDQVISINEKPSYSFFINTGIYVLGRDLVNSVKGIRHMNMTDFLSELIKRGGTVSTFLLYEDWLDIGQIQQFERAQAESEYWFK